MTPGVLYHHNMLHVIKNHWKILSHSRFVRPGCTSNNWFDGPLIPTDLHIVGWNITTECLLKNHVSCLRLMYVYAYIQCGTKPCIFSQICLRLHQSEIRSCHWGWINLVSPTFWSLGPCDITINVKRHLRSWYQHCWQRLSSRAGVVRNFYGMVKNHGWMLLYNYAVYTLELRFFRRNFWIEWFW